ncbi:UAA transporter, partial [Baffinella frigidus]
MQVCCMALSNVAVCCMALSNVAVQYLNYPTHILFKSAKPVPTLIVGTFLLQRRYNSLDYGAALLMLLGLVLFVAADEQAHVSTYGFTLVSVALVAE